ncbi:hypothetical protein [Profundibacter sp.]|uniref:hypothetical protein n=1 Tax=Profundibacter sp. TaxID=3101071 RepID=UPI003D0BB254
MAHAARDTGSPIGVTAKKLRKILDDVEKKYDVKMHLDKPHAEVFGCVSKVVEIDFRHLRAG